MLTAALAETAPGFAVAILETAMMLPDDAGLQLRCLRANIMARYRTNKSTLSRSQLEWLVDELAEGPDDLGDTREEMGRRYKLGWAIGAETFTAVANAEHDREHGTTDAKISGTRERASKRINEVRQRNPAIGTLSPETIKKAAPTFAPVAHLWAEHFKRGEYYGEAACPCLTANLGQFVANALLIQTLAERLHSHTRAGHHETIMRAGAAIRLPDSFVAWLPPASEDTLAPI